MTTTPSQPSPPTQPTQQQIDYAKWLEEKRREDAHRAHDKLEDFHTYVNEAAIKSGDATLRMLMLINGGAAAALLTFTGNLTNAAQKLSFANTLVWFATGVACAVAGVALSYFTNFFMAEHTTSLKRIWEHPYTEPTDASKRYRRLNVLFHFLAVVAGLLSLAAFVYGMLQVRNAFTHMS